MGILPRWRAVRVKRPFMTPPSEAKGAQVVGRERGGRENAKVDVRKDELLQSGKFRSDVVQAHKRRAGPDVELTTIEVGGTHRANVLEADPVEAENTEVGETSENKKQAGVVQTRRRVTNVGVQRDQTIAKTVDDDREEAVVLILRECRDAVTVIGH